MYKRRNNLLLILGAGIILSIAAYFLTMDKPTGYTGSNTFSPGPDARCCLPDTSRKLQNDFPADKQPVVRVRYSNKYYIIRAGDYPTLVAGKFGITLEKLYDLNDPMPPFQGGRRLIVGIVPDSTGADTVQGSPAKVDKAPAVHLPAGPGKGTDLRSGFHDTRNPVYTVKPNPPSRLFFVIMAFLAGSILAVALIHLLRYFDNSIRLPSRLEKLSGLKLIGAYPRVPIKTDAKINYPLLCSRSVDQILQRIFLEGLRTGDRNGQPFILFFVSTREHEGKSYIATRLVEKLRTSGSRVLFVKPAESHARHDLVKRFTSFDQPVTAWDYEYYLPDNFIGIKNINELLRNYTFLTKGYEFLVIELPALLFHEYPARLVQSGNFSILVVHSARTWNRADTESVALYKSTAGHAVMSLLNACGPEQLEGVVGEIPRHKEMPYNPA